MRGEARYERSPERVNTRAGHYERKLHTRAGEVKMQVPKLRSLPFETPIIEPYRRRGSDYGVGHPVQAPRRLRKNALTVSLSWLRPSHPYWATSVHAK
mgnify:CR=1 FL=1